VIRALPLRSLLHHYVGVCVRYVWYSLHCVVNDVFCMSSQPACVRACVLYRYYVTAAATGDDYDNHIHSGVASSCIGVSDYRPLSAFRT